MANDVTVYTPDEMMADPSKLSLEFVRWSFDQQGKCDDRDLFNFLALCKTKNLNPFTKEVYLLKTGNAPATIITARSVFERRAENHPNFAGKASGLIYETETSGVQESKGGLLPTNARILGAWAEVHRSDWKIPFRVEVNFSEFDRSKIREAAGQLGNNLYQPTGEEVNRWGKPVAKTTWDDMPAVMIRKVALVTALREAFPTELGGLHASEEMPVQEPVQELVQELVQKPVQKKSSALIKQAMKATGRAFADILEEVKEGISAEPTEEEIELMEGRLEAIISGAKKEESKKEDDDDYPF